MNSKKFLQKIIPISLLALLLLILLENNILVLAGTPYTYNPPKQRKKVIKSRTVSAGSRGCAKANFQNAKVRLLAPEAYVGLTTTSHPTFFWEVTANSPVQTRFTVVEPGEIEPIVDFQQLVQKSGVIKWQLPPQLPGLNQGKPYRWTVALICNPNRSSQNAYAYAWIERVPKSSYLTEYLKLRNVEPAIVYAREGIWYDALTEAYKNNSSSPSFLSLLIQLD